MRSRPCRGKLEILRTWKEDADRKNVEGESGAVIANSNAAGHKADTEGCIWRSEILLTIHEGRFHQVKRMMEAAGNESNLSEKNFHGSSDFAGKSGERTGPGTDGGRAGCTE